MGPINVADLPQGRRRVAFTGAEVARLVQEIKQRKDIIFGTKDQPPLPHQVRQAWEEIAEIISTVSDIVRSGEQCRKRFNDIKRRGQMMVAGRKRGRPPKNRPKVSDIQEIMDYKKHVEPEDMEFEIQAPMDDDDPDYEPTPKKREPKVVLIKEFPKPVTPKPEVDPPAAASYSPPPKPPTPSLPKPQSPSLPKAQSPSLPKPQAPSQPKPQAPSQPKPQTPLNRPQAPSQPRTGPPLAKPPGTKPKIVLVRKPAGSADPAVRQHQEDDKHPFLELQQAGFDMLKRELSGFRDSVMSLNTRLNHLEVALRPIGGIADSLARIANAVERLTSPPE